MYIYMYIYIYAYLYVYVHIGGQPIHIKSGKLVPHKVITGPTRCRKQKKRGSNSYSTGCNSYSTETNIFPS